MHITRFHRRTRSNYERHVLGYRWVAWSCVVLAAILVLTGACTGTGVAQTNEAARPIGEPLLGHGTLGVFSVAFSPDGNILASADDVNVTLWDVATRKPIGEPLSGHRSNVSSVAFSLDGKTLASGSLDATVRLWSIVTHRTIGEPLRAHTSGGDPTYGDAVYSVAFSPDGKTLAAGSADHTVRLWDVATRTPIGKPLSGHAFGVRCVAFSPDGRVLASASNDGTLRLWDVASRQALGEPLRVDRSSNRDTVYGVAFSPDGKMLASADSDGMVHLWDVATHKPMGFPLRGQSGRASC